MFGLLELLGPPGLVALLKLLDDFNVVDVLVVLDVFVFSRFLILYMSDI